MIVDIHNLCNVHQFVRLSILFSSYFLNRTHIRYISLSSPGMSVLSIPSSSLGETDDSSTPPTLNLVSYLSNFGFNPSINFKVEASFISVALLFCSVKVVSFKRLV